MKPEVSVVHGMNDIAIIGMACRLPGKSNSPQQFWEFLLNGGDGIVDVPADRWDAEAYYDSDRNIPGKMYVRRGGFIENIDQFDPQFFGISPKEAPHIDPQHRWLLELAYESFENAGLKLSDLKGSDTAVFIGQFMHDYEQIQLDRLGRNEISSHSATGPSMTLTANRISYSFDFTGPSVTLDTACSSSLVALDMACNAILNNDSKLALAGGVNILLRPELTMSICKASMLSPDMQCKSFDASANGYVRSEGAALVLVKRLSEALRDGDPVLAVIKATGVNQDGQTNGITVPNGSAQQKLLQKTLARAQFESSQIQYAEAHGTGTAVGDPIEVNALAATLGQRPRDQETCVIGSVKSNIGHTEATAGVAALIKTVMAMNHGVIPKNLHLNQVNPAIDLAELNVRLAQEHMPWPTTGGQTRKAIVNSFGFGGTNANAVLEQAPLHATIAPRQPQEPRQQWLTLSGKSEKSLLDNAARFLQHLQQSTDELDDILFSASTRREHWRFRAVINGETRAQFEQGLADLIAGKPGLRGVQGMVQSELNPHPVFVFSGMGTTWASMGKALYDSEPVFRAEMQRCDSALQPLLGWSLLEAMWQSSDPESIHQTNIAQPAIFSTQVALAALLAARGIVPAAIVGHSAGEVAASYVAGALSFEDAIKVIYHRSLLQHTTEGMGKMLAVALTQAQLQPYLAGHEQQVSVAAINSNDAITLSGDENVLAEIARQLDDKGIFARFLKVEVPYHSPVMESLKQPLQDALQSIRVMTPHTALYSTVTGKITAEGDWGASYWPQNVREPVFFMQAIEQILADGFNTFIEVAPHNALAGSIKKNLRGPGLVVTTMKRDQNDAIMLAQTISALHVAGIALDWPRLMPAGARFVTLPNYAWQHARYWQENEVVRESRIKNQSVRNGFIDTNHPLLGARLNSQSAIWQTEVDLQKLTYLNDHQIENDIVYPGAAYVENGLAIASSLDRNSITLEEIGFHRALFLDSKKPLTMECALDTTSLAYKISALDSNSGQWQVFGSGTISEQEPAAPAPLPSVAELQAALSQHKDKAAFYQHCHQLGLSYQPRFQAVCQAWHNDLNALVELRLPAVLEAGFGASHLHPSLLDGAFQSLFVTVDSGYLPVRIGQLHYFRQPPQHCYAYLQTRVKTADLIRGDLHILDAAGNVLVAMFDVEVHSSKTRSGVTEAAAMYDFTWQLQALPPAAAAVPQTWLMFMDRQGVARQLAASLEQQGQQVVRIEQGSMFDQTGSHHFRANLDDSACVLPVLQQFANTSAGIVYCWGIDSTGMDTRHSTISALALAQAMDQVNWTREQRVFFVTSGAQQVAHEIAQPAGAALWGLGRVFANEHQENRLTLLDLAQEVTPAMAQAAAAEMLSAGFEQEVALRADGRYVHRLRKVEEAQLQHYLQHPVRPACQEAWQLQLDSHGWLASSVDLAPLAGHEVRLALDHVALEPARLSRWQQSHHPAGDIDVLNECSGRVLATGKQVTGLQPGDEVFGFARGACASQTNAAATLLQRKPAQLSGALAAALPAALVSMQHCLHSLTRLEPGMQILIHDAASLGGRVALHMAQAAGVRVFATAATQAQQQQLLALGVLAAFDSHSASFVPELLAHTGQQGVDLVLNTLPGQLRLKTLSVLRPMGQFIDLEPHAVPSDAAWAALLGKLAVSYHAFHLDTLLRHAPELAMRHLQTALAQWNEAQLAALPWQLLEPVTTPPAVLAQQKLVLPLGHVPERRQSSPLQFVVRAGRSYMVTGGLGGLGLEMMRWLAAQGAESVVLLGRRSATGSALEQIETVRAKGVLVTVLQADIGVEADVARVFAQIAQDLPPLAGIIHSAGVLDDGTMMQQTAARFEKVLAPKVAGSWYLHQHSQHLPLDFFVLFSSIAAVVGWPGQSNYAAGNAFMDALAAHRQAQGLAALSVNWGPWAEVGMAANLDQRDSERMKEAGMYPLSAASGLQGMQRALAWRLPQAGIFDLDWSLIFKSFPDPARLTLFKDLIDQDTTATGTNLMDQLLALDAAQRSQRLADEMALILAEVLGLDNPSAIDPGQSVFEYGMNSLMAIDFKNRLQGKLHAKLPATLVLKHPTVQAMVQFVVQNHLSAPPVPTLAADQITLTI